MAHNNAFDSAVSSPNEYSESKNETSNDIDETITSLSSSMPTGSSSNTPKQFIKFSSSNTSGSKTVELRKKIDGRGFNLLDMFSRGNKAKTDLLTPNEPTHRKNSNKSNDSLGKSNGLSNSYSFLPSFLVSSSQRGDEEKIVSTPESTQVQPHSNHQTVVDAVSDAFDKQLKQIDNLENEFSQKIKKSARNPAPASHPMKINFNNLDSKNNQLEVNHRRRQVTRIVGDTSTNKQQRITFDINSLTKSLATSPENSNFNIKPKEEKLPVGSLFTATSLDNNNNFFENSSFFENINDYVDSLNLNSKEPSDLTGYESNTQNTDEPYQARMQYAFSESSDDDDEDESSSKKSQKISKYENVSSTNEIDNELMSNESDESDDSDDSDLSKTMFVVIKPLEKANQAASPEVLRQTGKCLTLNMSSIAKKKQPTINSTVVNNNESLTSISSINNILPSSSPSMSSERDVSRSLSALSMQQQINSSIHESNQDNPSSMQPRLAISMPEQQQQPKDQNNNLSVFQMDKVTNMEGETINKGPPVPPLPLTIKLKYQDLLYSQYNLSQKTNLANHKSKSETGSFENLSYDCLSDLSTNNSPVNVKNNNNNINKTNLCLKLPGESFAKF
jgi:hypothetical protein